MNCKLFFNVLVRYQSQGKENRWHRWANKRAQGRKGWTVLPLRYNRLRYWARLKQLFFFPVALKLGICIQWYGGHLTILKFFIWRCPNSGDAIKNLKSSPRMAIFYLRSLKSDSNFPKKICFNDSPSKVMKNAFYFILKTFFVVKIFKFLSWHFDLLEKMAWLEG